MKTTKNVARDLLGLVAGDARVGEGTVRLGRALLSTGVTAMFLAVTLIERHDGIAVLALFFPMVAAGIWAAVMWDTYLHGKPQAVEVAEKDTPKNPSEASEVKEGRAQEPAVETPQAPELSTAEEAVETGKENPVNKPTASDMGVSGVEKATPEKTTLPDVGELRGIKSSPSERTRKGRPEGEVDLSHEWPGVSEILASADAVLKQHGIRGWWVPAQQLQLRLTTSLARPENGDRELLAAVPEAELKALQTLGGLYRQAFMMREAITSRIETAAAAKVKDLAAAAAVQGAVGSLEVARHEVVSAGNLALKAMKAMGVTPGIHAMLVSRPETAFGVEESIAFARKVVDKFGAGKEQEVKPEPPAPKPSPVAPPRVRHQKPALGDVEKATPKNQAPAHQAGAEGEVPTLADLWPDLTGQGKEGHQQ